MCMNIFKNNYKISVAEIMINRDSVFWIIVCSLIITPFIYFKKYKKTSKLGFISFICVVGVIVLLCIACFIKNSNNDIHDVDTRNFNFDDFLFAIPIFVFSVSSHHTIVDFFYEITR